MRSYAFTTLTMFDNLQIWWENLMSIIKKKNWDDKIVLSKVDGLLSKFDDGELFVEEVFSENILFDDNKVKNASYDQDRGFGLRTVKGDSINFYHSSELNEDTLNHGIKSINKNQTILFKPKINDIIIFNSFIEHSVDNKTLNNVDRISLPFDLIF